MSGPGFRPATILAIADGAHGADALRAAAALCARHGASLEIMTCAEPPRDLETLSRLSRRSPEALIDLFSADRRQAIEARVADTLPDFEGVIHVAVGKAFIEIIRHAQAVGADMVVKAGEPVTGVNRFLFSSTDQHLLRKCPCALWLHGAPGPAAPRRVIAAVDVDTWDAAEPETLTALNRRVIETARAVAAPEAEVIALHAWDAAGEGAVWAFSDAKDGRKAADAYVREMRQMRDAALHDLVAPFDHAPPVIPRLVRGAPEQVIAQTADALDADAVVMGTIARTGLGGVIIGNTAENTINALGRSVIAVKPEGFVSPIKPL